MCREWCQDEQKKRVRLLYAGVAEVFLIVLCLGMGRVSAKEGKTIRVGYYPMENYHWKNEAGNMVGYEVDYLNRIAEITGWNYEYIEADSWNDAMDMLRNGDIDMLSPGEITRARTTEFIFSAMPIGKSYGAVMIPKDSEQLYENFDEFSKMTFGIEQGLTYARRFREYAREEGFQPSIKFYKNHDELKKALKSGEIDAIVANIMRIDEDTKIAGRFRAASYYLMMRKIDTELKAELDDALYQVDTMTPNLEANLINKYFPVYNIEPMTMEEMEFASEMRELVVGCPVNTDPVSYVDETTGEVAGITRDILERISADSGIRFRFQALPDGIVSYDILRELDIDLIACVEYNSENLNTESLKMTVPYFQSRKVMVGREGERYGKDSKMKISVASGSVTLKKMISASYPHAQIIMYDTVEECLDAVVSKKADVLLQNQYAIDSWLSKPKYEGLAVIQAEGVQDEHCLSAVVFKDEPGKVDEELCNPILFSILNKAIHNLPEEEVSRIIVNQTVSRKYNFTIEDIIYRYRYLLTLLTVTICAGTVIAFYAIQMKKRNIRLIALSERRLQNITNNINGGVLILLPNEGLQLSYANSGFWKLLQYDKDEIPNLQNVNYIMYVHPDDISVLDDLVENYTGKYEQITMRLRIRRKDGKYLPVTFSGTIAENEDGNKEMFCVIMDISREVSMLHKLQIEEEKYTFLIKKAEEMIYEVDFEKKRLTVSDAFLRKFGWDFEKKNISIEKKDLLAAWKIHEKDIPVMEDMYTSVMEKSEDTQGNVRIVQKNGDYRWCQIQFYTMKDRDGDTRLLLGKIADIDDEIREKKRLTEQSRKDALTGLYNKESFKYVCRKYMESHSMDEYAVVFCDLDHFKAVNDQLGHLIGDQAIIDAANKIKGVFDKDALIGRFGGDEFCVFAQSVKRDELEERVRVLVEGLDKTYSENGKFVTITASVGIAYLPQRKCAIEELLEYADKALYQVKESGRNHYRWYEEE